MHIGVLLSVLAACQSSQCQQMDSGCCHIQLVTKLICRDFSVSSFACLQISAEEQKKMDEKVMVDGVKRVVSKLLARRKLKRSYEYEVQWEGQPSSSDYTAWLSRDRSVSTLCVIFTVCWCATRPVVCKSFFW